MGREFHTVGDLEADAFLSRKEACEILQITDRTLYRYAKRGLVRQLRKKRRWGVHREDVQAILASRNPGDGDVSLAFNRFGFNQLVTEVRLQAKKIETMMSILNIRRAPLNLTDLEAQNFYQMCVMYAENGWPPHIEEELSERFLRIRYEDLEQLSRLTNDPHPWRPLYRLCMTMHFRPYDLRLKDALASARREFERLSVLWVEMRGGSGKAFEIMTEKDALPFKRLLRELSRTQVG